MRKSTAVGMNESSEDPENVLLQNMITDRDEMGFGSTQQTNGSNAEIPLPHHNQMFDAYKDHGQQRSPKFNQGSQRDHYDPYQGTDRST